MNTNSDKVWFSVFFGVDRPQYELPFVDFDLNRDVPLYIDPYAITKDPTDLAAHAHNAIHSFFQTLLEAIQRDNPQVLRRLLRGHLGEPVEIHLGVSKVARRGRGMGQVQEQQIIVALAESRAAQVGIISAIEELELHIEGIGPDKISDLVANIILRYLAIFTEKVCLEYGISTQPVALSGYWNQEYGEWDGGYFNLPVHHTHAYVLVPKRWVRRRKDLLNHEIFYNKYVLDILKHELIRAEDSLVQTLKSGARNVTKKSIKEDSRFNPSKEFISAFIMEHPEALNQYRQDLTLAFNPADPAFWSGKAEEDDPRVLEALRCLETLPSGKNDANTYHNTIVTLIEFVFDWALENFTKEQHMDHGRSRIDIVADNYATGGVFWLWRADFNALTIPMECKNYAGALGNNEYNQILDRLGPKTSRIGFIFCRTVQDRRTSLQHCSDRWLRHSLIILVFDDDTLKHLITLRLARNVQEIMRLLEQMVRQVQYNAV